VELLGYYSRQTNWAKGINRLLELAVRVRVVTQGNPYESVLKLRPDQVQELVAQYEAGASMCELAALFKVHRTTVSAHLRRQGLLARRH
jgi:hypothetical protein